MSESLSQAVIHGFLMALVFLWLAGVIETRWIGDQTYGIVNATDGKNETIQNDHNTTGTSERRAKMSETNVTSKVLFKESPQFHMYKTMTIVLGALCVVMTITSVVLAIKLRRKNQCETSSSTKSSDETPLTVVKTPDECEYQSIRGFTKRYTTSSYGYETVKPKLPTTRPPLPQQLTMDNGEYENLKKSGLKPKTREYSVYLTMDEAIAGLKENRQYKTNSALLDSAVTGNCLLGSALTGSAILLAGGNDEDLYQTMKKIVKPVKDPATEQRDVETT